MARKKKILKKDKWFPVILGCVVLSIASVAVLSYHASQRPLVDTLDDLDQFHNPAPILPRPLDARQTVQIPILMYHYIEHVKDPRDTIRQKLNIYPETLDAQLKTMTSAGYTFLYASEVADILDGKKPMPSKPIVLTFDDGYRDFYTDAFPILLKYKVKSTAYIISGFLNQPNYMTSEQLGLVAGSGYVEIGAHTMHHIDLQHASALKASEEIIGSKKELEALLHIPIVSFAYPGGRFNPTTVTIVSQAGFTNAVSTLLGTTASTSNRFLLYRLRPGSRTGAHLLSFLDKEASHIASVTLRSQPE